MPLLTTIVFPGTVAFDNYTVASLVKVRLLEDEGDSHCYYPCVFSKKTTTKNKKKLKLLIMF